LKPPDGEPPVAGMLTVRVQLDEGEAIAPEGALPLRREGALLVVLGIDDQRQQHEILPETAGKALLELAEIARQAKAIRGVGTAQIGEGYRGDLPRQLRRGDRPRWQGRRGCRRELSSRPPENDPSTRLADNRRKWSPRTCIK